MTMFRCDDTPKTWHKLVFRSDRLHLVHQYIRQNGATAVIRGAITIGILGPSDSLVCFKDEQEFAAFQRWFTAENQTPMENCIYIGEHHDLGETADKSGPEDDRPEFAYFQKNGTKIMSLQEDVQRTSPDVLAALKSRWQDYFRR